MDYYGIIKTEIILKDGIEVVEKKVDWHRVKIITYNLVAFGMQAGGMMLALKMRRR